MTSDDYFATENPRSVLGRTIDFAFLDGMHLAEFLLRDFANTEKHCAKNSIIALHDCLPVDREMTAREEAVAIANCTPGHPGWWTGDVWLTIEALKKYRPDLKIMAFDAPPTGLIVITNLNPISVTLKEHYREIEMSMRDAKADKSRYLDYVNSLPIQSTLTIKTTEDIARHFSV
jgi:hypothetical protein